MATTTEEAIYQWREVLTGEVEADDVHLTIGQQGRTLRPKDSPEKTSEEAGSGFSEANQSGKAKSEQHASRESRERGLSERAEEVGPETGRLQCYG